jgi:RHH-type transcriptional regulator, proline utilization regulon repressor / proline dehydrogenase / delta 1-pyrroline-5-carboxylate dehydrogenase
MPQALGDLIDGTFLPPEGQPLISRDPTTGTGGDARVVFETAWRAERVDAACAAAAAAGPAWRGLAGAERDAAVARLEAALAERRGALTAALVEETGRVVADAEAEVDALLATFEASETALRAEAGPFTARDKEAVHVRALGVLGIIGPADRPLLHGHRHVVPALRLGDTVVIKPSPIAPLSAQIYAEAAHAALPAGVLNLVQGEAAAGEALVAHPALGGLCATVSRATAAAIRLAGNRTPERPLHLMIGGRNPAVVLDDANLRQTVHGLVLGGYGATGLRCLALQHVLVHRDRAEALVDALAEILETLRFGDPGSPESFAGPLPTGIARDRFDAALASATGSAVARAILAGGPGSDPVFHRPSLHLLEDAAASVPGYTDREVLGPDLCIAPFDDDDALAAALEGLSPSPAASVFTTDRRRFEAVRRHLRADAVGWNRSPHPLSPRLPAGGALAHRHVAVPMSVSIALPGELKPEAGLAARLPPPDLDRLERQHAREEADEAGRDILSAGGRPLAVKRPPGGSLPASEAWLARLYADERVVREKKPPVFDHLRSFGPFYVSVDESPLAVLDGMSQTATLPGGFAADAVVRAYVEGGFGETVASNPDSSVEVVPEAWAFADRLRALLPNLPHVAFTGSGAEANEKALALCRLAAPSERATKVLAFEGGFHGRTLLALHATANPAKRAPYEIAGYEATFAPFPVWPTPMEAEPGVPGGFLDAAAKGDLPRLRTLAEKVRGELLLAEVRALEAVHTALSSGEHFVCIVEPMQSEGGDRYATARFYKALRLLTRFHGVPLVFDEVQCGFGLGGPFAWHSRFGLVDEGGDPDGPDAVTFAKRAQVGVCMSRFEDPEPGAAHLASIVRGRLHLDVIADPGRADQVAEWVRPRLLELATRYPQLVKNPRARGYALAFDLPTPQHLAAYLGQRFWRGAIVFGAGDRTVRYRLNTSWEKREVERLFVAIRRSLSWLDAHPNQAAPIWEDSGPDPKTESAPRLEYRVRTLAASEAEVVFPEILALEASVYEAARRDPPERLRLALEDPDGIVIVAEALVEGTWRMVGASLGTPIERLRYVEGPDRDPMLGRHNTLYSLTLTVDGGHQGAGLGRMLKTAQMEVARGLRLPDGRPRYRYVTGRNRVDRAAAMTRLNRHFGAHVLAILEHQYGTPEGRALYYRIPLGAPAPDPDGPAEPPAETPPASGTATARMDLASGLTRPFAAPPASLRQAEAHGALYGPAVNKLTLCNYVTPASVRAVEWTAALLPELPHLYLTSGRDECVDKSLRILRWHRKAAAVAIGLDGGYLGHTTAAARSLSDPAVHAMGPPHFDWPRVPHPAEVGPAATAASLREAITAAGGPDAVFGIFLEAVQERTGRVLPDDLWPALHALREETGVPIVLVENATACYRSGRGPFAFGGAARPDLVTWWGGAQCGYIHAAGRLFVPTPLTMVSTWDGDELSLVREHHQLRAARRIDVAGASAALDAALEPVRKAGMRTLGLGLYRVIEAGDEAARIHVALGQRGVLLRALPGGRLAVIPPLDAAEEAARRLAAACKEIL